VIESVGARQVFGKLAVSRMERLVVVVGRPQRIALVALADIAVDMLLPHTPLVVVTTQLVVLATRMIAELVRHHNLQMLLVVAHLTKLERRKIELVALAELVRSEWVAVELQRLQRKQLIADQQIFESVLMVDMEDMAGTVGMDRFVVVVEPRQLENAVPPEPLEVE
jgi:hypothetical protein